METKKLLARTIVSEFHGEEAAKAAEAVFERTVQRKEAPDEMPEFEVTEGESLLEVVVRAGLAPSRRESRRLFEQHAVALDDVTADASTLARKGSVLQVGKRRWLRLV